MYNVFRSWYRVHSVLWFEQPGHVLWFEQPERVFEDQDRHEHARQQRHMSEHVLGVRTKNQRTCSGCSNQRIISTCGNHMQKHGDICN